MVKSALARQPNLDRPASDQLRENKFSVTPQRRRISRVACRGRPNWCRPSAAHNTIPSCGRQSLTSDDGHCDVTTRQIPSIATASPYFMDKIDYPSLTSLSLVFCCTPMALMRVRWPSLLKEARRWPWSAP